MQKESMQKKLKQVFRAPVLIGGGWYLAVSLLTLLCAADWISVRWLWIVMSGYTVLAMLWGGFAVVRLIRCREFRQCTSRVRKIGMSGSALCLLTGVALATCLGVHAYSSWYDLTSCLCNTRGMAAAWWLTSFAGSGIKTWIAAGILAFVLMGGGWLWFGVLAMRTGQLGWGELCDWTCRWMLGSSVFAALLMSGLDFWTYRQFQHEQSRLEIQLGAPFCPALLLAHSFAQGAPDPVFFRRFHEIYDQWELRPGFGKAQASDPVAREKLAAQMDAMLEQPIPVLPDLNFESEIRSLVDYVAPAEHWRFSAGALSRRNRVREFLWRTPVITASWLVLTMDRQLEHDVRRYIQEGTLSDAELSLILHESAAVLATAPELQRRSRWYEARSMYEFCLRFDARDSGWEVFSPAEIRYLFPHHHWLLTRDRLRCVRNLAAAAATGIDSPPKPWDESSHGLRNNAPFNRVRPGYHPFSSSGTNIHHCSDGILQQHQKIILAVSRELHRRRVELLPRRPDAAGFPPQLF